MTTTLPPTLPPAPAKVGRPAPTPPPPTPAKGVWRAPPGDTPATPAKQRRVLAPRQPRPIVPRLVVHGVEGVGKTTIGAYADSPFIIMARGELGYDALLSAGRVPMVPAEVVESWPDLLGWVSDLCTDPQGCKTLVLDALSGFERLCHEHVRRRDFDGEWGERGFGAYQRGYEVAVADWIDLLGRLDSLIQCGITVVILGHVQIRAFKNPLGPDYDRYVSDAHAKTWGVTHKWADAVLFANFLTIIDDERKARRTGKGKGVGGADRVVYTERRDAYDAKNRFGLPSEIWLTDDPTESWGIIRSHIMKGNQK